MNAQLKRKRVAKNGMNIKEREGKNSNRGSCCGLLSSCLQYSENCSSVSEGWLARQENVRDRSTPCFVHSFSILSDDRFKASSKTIPPHSAI